MKFKSERYLCQIHLTFVQINPNQSWQRLKDFSCNRKIIQFCYFVRCIIWRTLMLANVFKDLVKFGLLTDLLCFQVSGKYKTMFLCSLKTIYSLVLHCSFYSHHVNSSIFAQENTESVWVRKNSLIFVFTKDLNISKCWCKL